MNTSPYIYFRFSFSRSSTFLTPFSLSVCLSVFLSFFLFLVLFLFLFLHVSLILVSLTTHLVCRLNPLTRTTDLKLTLRSLLFPTSFLCVDCRPASRMLPGYGTACLPSYGFLSSLESSVRKITTQGRGKGKSITFQCHKREMTAAKKFFCSQFLSSLL